jgi:soluble lytic murein transglycosylase-like protein
VKKALTIAACLLAAGTILAAAPAGAQESARHGPAISCPAQLSPAEREAYRAIFAALRAQDWAGAAGRLGGMPEGPLHNLARAMLYTMPGSPRVELAPVMDLLARAPELPQADDLARLARARGAETLPDLPQAQRLYGLTGQPRRARPRPIQGDPVADQLEPLIQPLIRDDHAVEAEALLATRSAELSDEARTAFQQRIAWVYFLNGLDADARRIADLARTGPTEYAVNAEWVSGLAAWRMGDYAAAANHFATVAMRSSDIELVAAGHYWAARADTAGGHPERVQNRLRAAARLDETFYGLLAQSALAMRQVPADMTTFTEADWQALSGFRNVRAAIALSEIGEDDLAASMIRRQAAIGNPRDHEHLIHLAARLNLTATQMYLAHNGPRGSRFGPNDRYPTPNWRPVRGWRVDPSLAFAHALQESQFRTDAVSTAGARGLMQVRPGTAGDMARARGETFTAASLNQPAVNIEYGQSYLEYLRDYAGTGGLLPKVIASYNAGPAPVAEWNTRYDQSDPLFYIEAIPYWETRGYVPIILRNYWIYEARGGDRSSSRRALAQGLWPRFPGLPGPAAVRIGPRPQQQTAMGAD